MTIYTRPDDLPAWAESGDKVQPTNAEIQAGWPFSTVPPSRQRFNWILNYVANAIRYFMQRSIAEWDITEDYPLGARLQHGGVTWLAVAANSGVTPGTDATKWERWGYASTELLPRVDSLISISVAGSGSPTLTQAQYDNGIITLTGLLTGNINVVFPNIARKWIVRNQTTGAFTIGLKTSAGSAYMLSQNESQSIYCDAANNIYQSVVASAVTPDASTTVKGIVELATNAETQTGTDALRAVTPAGMASVTSTETRAGLAELATDAEAQAYTANKFIDGAKLATALKGSNQSLSTNGYQRLPGGLILQWGETADLAAEVEVAVTFPIAFPTLAIITTAFAYTGARVDNSQVAHVREKSLSGFTAVNDQVAAAGKTGKINWIAIGY